VTGDARSHRAERVIVEQVVAEVERAREAQGLLVSDLAVRSGISRRSLVSTRKLQSRPTLRSLLALLNAVGLELRITVRPKRSSRLRVEDAQFINAPVTLALNSKQEAAINAISKGRLGKSGRQTTGQTEPRDARDSRDVAQAL